MTIPLDFNATTPLFPEVVEAMLPWLREGWGNPSSAHAWGRQAKQAVERARAEVASLVNASPDEIVFTSGGTEANNLALRGAAEALKGQGKVLVTSAIEHPAVSRPSEWLAEHGWRVIRLAVNLEGQVALGELPDRADLVSVMHSNNETGVLQPVQAVAEWGRRCGARVHTDAAQSVGKVPIDVRALGVDFLSIAGHKLYAPKGVGALYLRGGAPLVPLLLGAGQERGVRPGTENVASIVGLGVACRRVGVDLVEAAARMCTLRDALHRRLAKEVPGLALNGHRTERLPNTLSVRFPGVPASQLLAACPEVAASAGSACHEGQETPSSVILAMGVAAEEAMGTVRLSLGRSTTTEEVDRAADDLARAWARLAGGRHTAVE